MESQRFVAEDMPRCSIIIPVYNAAPYLRAGLESVLEQTLHDIEIVCVDDGSADTSGAILSEFAAQDNRIRVLTQGNCGQGAARNRGLEVVNGEYIYFMDADDELATNNALERLVNEADRTNLDVLFFDANTAVDDGLEVSPSVIRADDYIRRNDYSSLQTGRELFASLIENREYTVSPCLMLVRRKFIEKNRIRFPDARIFHEDNILMTRVMLAAERVSHRPWRFYLRKVHADSTVTSKPTLRHLRGYVECYIDVCDIIKHGEWDRRTAAALRDRQRIYKLHVRRIVDAHPELVAAANGEMLANEQSALRAIMVYPIGERIVNAFKCFRERGFLYTIRRIFLGRQET